MGKQRLEYVDAVKGFAILLMIVGHCTWINSFPRLFGVIYSFHMPIFFIISGMFIKQMDWYHSLIKYSKAYLKPYFILCSLLLIIKLIRAAFLNENIIKATSNWAIRSFFASGWDKGGEFLATTPQIGCIWFLFALFWACLLFSIIKYYVHSKTEVLIWVWICFLVGSISIKYIRFPFSLQPGLCAVAYIWVGNTLYKFPFLEKAKKLAHLV